MDRRRFLQNAVLGATGLGLSGSSLAAQSVVFVPGTGDSDISSLEKPRLRPELMAKAYKAYSRHQSSVRQRDIMAIADFSAPSRLPRFYLLNMLNGQSTPYLVAHGKGSDPDHSGWLQYFSNLPGSEASSSGSYIVDDIYYGEHGQSRRLTGLDPENDQAESRAIVIHPAWYVSEQIAQQQGKIGRSQGCFALSDNDIGEVLTRLGSGTMLFADKI